MFRKIGKRVLLMILAVSLIFLFAGCRKEEVNLVDKPKAQTVIHMFSSSGIFSTSNQAKYWSEHFSEITGINAAVDFEEGWYYSEKGQDGRALLRTRIESGSGDDMYIVNAEDMIEFARKGYIMDMSDFEFVKNLSESARQLSTIDGKVYCLPLTYTGFGLYWNVELLQKYGLEIPRNYGELIEVWDALLEHGITPLVGNKGYALTVPAMCMSFADIYQNEEKDKLLGELADGSVPVSTYARRGFEFIKLMCDKGYLNPQDSLEIVPNSEEESAPFHAGDVACVCSIMSTEQYCDPENTGFKVKMTGWPLLEAGEISVVGTDQKLCANPDSDNLDIVTQFIELAGSVEALQKCTDEGKVSAGKVNDPSKYLETERDFAELIQSDGQIPNTDMNLKLNLWEDIRDISRLILSDEVTVDEACQMLDEMQKEEIAADKAVK